MGVFKRKPNPRIKELEECASVLIGKQLAEVWYHDGRNEDDGLAYFLEDVHPNRHELMHGVDLITAEGHKIGFHWKWFVEEYELEVTTKGVGSILKTDLAPFNQSDEEHWAQRINKTITNLTFTTDNYDNVCDCRVAFDDADPVWICARFAGDGCLSNGHDTVVVFTEQEARQLGIKVDT